MQEITRTIYIDALIAVERPYSTSTDVPHISSLPVSPHWYRRIQLWATVFVFIRLLVQLYRIYRRLVCYGGVVIFAFQPEYAFFACKQYLHYCKRIYLERVRKSLDSGLINLSLEL
jgi:hypothetical protein